MGKPPRDISLEQETLASNTGIPVGKIQLDEMPGYQPAGGADGVIFPSRAVIASLPVDLLDSMVKSRNFEQAKKSLRIPFDNVVTQTFLERFKTRLEKNTELCDAFYGEAYQSYKDEHFFNLSEHHDRFKDINPYSGKEEYFTAAQHKERMELLAASCWDTFIDSSSALPCPTLVWDAQDATNKNYLDRTANELHITAYDYPYGQGSAQTMLACILSHSIDLTSGGRLSDGFGAYGLLARNKIPEQVQDPQADVTRTEMQAIICREASGIFLTSVEQAMREHLFLDIENQSLYAMNPHQRNSLLTAVHPVGACHDADGKDPKYHTSFFSSEGAKNDFILRVNANCPVDETYQRMYNEAQGAFWKDKRDLPYFRQAWEHAQNSAPANAFGAVNIIFSAIEKCWRDAAKEAVVLSDKTGLPIYYGHLGKDTRVEIDGVGHNIDWKLQQRQDANARISILPAYEEKSEFDLNTWIAQGQPRDGGHVTTRHTTGHVIHIPFDLTPPASFVTLRVGESVNLRELTLPHWTKVWNQQKNPFWNLPADAALKQIGWMYIVGQHMRIDSAYREGRLKKDNPFYAFASRSSTWHDGGDICRLDWMVSRIKGHERDGIPTRLADNFLKKPAATISPPK
jgi:hypothetical protein